MHPAVFRAGLAAMVLCAVACPYASQPVYPGQEVTTVPVDGVKVTPQSIVFDSIGAVRQVLVTVSPANATDRSIRWETTDATVATVDSTGLVTAKSAGAGVFITAFTKDHRHQASVNVIVEPPGVRAAAIRNTKRGVVRR